MLRVLDLVVVGMDACENGAVEYISHQMNLFIAVPTMRKTKRLAILLWTYFFKFAFFNCLPNFLLG